MPGQAVSRRRSPQSRGPCGQKVGAGAAGRLVAKTGGIAATVPLAEKETPRAVAGDCSLEIPFGVQALSTHLPASAHDGSQQGWKDKPTVEALRIDEEVIKEESPPGLPKEPFEVPVAISAVPTPMLAQNSVEGVGQVAKQPRRSKSPVGRNVSAVGGPGGATGVARPVAKPRAAPGGTVGGAAMRRAISPRDGGADNVSSIPRKRQQARKELQQILSSHFATLPVETIEKLITWKIRYLWIPAIDIAAIPLETDALGLSGLGEVLVAVEATVSLEEISVMEEDASLFREQTPPENFLEQSSGAADAAAASSAMEQASSAAGVSPQLLAGSRISPLGRISGQIQRPGASARNSSKKRTSATKGDEAAFVGKKGPGSLESTLRRRDLAAGSGQRERSPGAADRQSSKRKSASKSKSAWEEQKVASVNNSGAQSSLTETEPAAAEPVAVAEFVEVHVSTAEAAAQAATAAASVPSAVKLRI